MSFIASQIVTKGIDSIDYSMISQDLRKKVFTEAGELFIKNGKSLEGIKSLIIAENIKLLKEYSIYFTEKGLFELAILCAINIKDKKLVADLAPLCLEKGACNEAIKGYEFLNEKEICSLIKENFI